MKEIWMISNRQPWVEALLRGITNLKSRSLCVSLPPPGSIVFLHASKALWSDWKYLSWVKDQNIDVRNLPRGGVCGVACCKEKGPMWEIEFSDEANEVFNLYHFYKDSKPEVWANCMDDQLIVFEKIKRIPFIPCKGVLTPTRKLPPELKRYIQNHPEILRQP